MKSLIHNSWKSHFVHSTNLPFFIFLSVILSIGCGSNLKLNSNWRQQDIAIDGEQTEWRNAMTFVEKKNVSIGVANDAEFVYVCMTSTDPQLLRQIMALGFTLWFDPEGGEKKTFGIRFPIGLMSAGFVRMPPRDRDNDQGPHLEAMRENFEQSLRKIEVIWPEKKERLRFNNISTLPGIEAKVKLSDPADLLVYEIKVPLEQTDQHQFAIGTEAGEQLGIGFETTEPNREELRERMGRGGVGGGRGGGGRGRGGPGGGTGGRMGGRRPQRPEQFKLWLSVRLDSQNISPSVHLMGDQKRTSSN